MLLKQTYWHRGLRWRTWCTEVGKLPESKNLTVLYHLIMGNYYLVKKKKIPLQMRWQGAGTVKIECPLEREALSVFKVLHQTNSMFSQRWLFGGTFWKQGSWATTRFSSAKFNKNHTSAEQQQLTPAESSALHIQKKNKIHKHPAERKLPKLSALLSFGGRKYGFVLHMLQAIVSQPLCLN